MADKKKQQTVASFDQALQASRQNRNAKLAQEMLGTDPKKLAQEMLGSKGRRISTPKMIQAPATLASRVGVQKVGIRSDMSNGFVRGGAVNGGGSELNIRGAASGPYIVRAQNFAPGTTAADIESVMQNVGGPMTYCKLVAAVPTVIAEMSFVERSGAEKVIEMFNGKKVSATIIADGRTLYVYFEASASSHPIKGRARQEVQEEEPLPAVVDVVGDEEMQMDVDEHAEDRAAQDRAREMHRGRDTRDVRYPTGPAADYERRRYDDREYDGRRYNGGGGGGMGRGYSGRGYPQGPRRGASSYRP
ncbi:hypothetical protein B0A50_04637 [Salinomyces thailandicus]|uniref:RNA-binding protein n=1 Tax=Salinomyces thailandicus TaxID=706561 RepID=A0A4U0TV00_9PEZI|nr:hypothetical protein B0A50_04637 [Salinomyces thailandica]